jgi:hypothetical protein
MNQIVPVHLGETGPRVTNLHVALQFLIGNQGNPISVTQILLQQLAPDVAANTFGQATRNIVAIYQGQLKNWPTASWGKLPQRIIDLVQLIPADLPGDVDDVTAQVLNWLVEKFGGMPSPSPARGKVRPSLN